MAEAVGAGGVLLPASDVGIGRLGQAIHHVAPVDIAEALVRLLTDEGLREQLQTAGFANAARYGWNVLESAACSMVSSYQVPGEHPTGRNTECFTTSAI
jgi:hypothetical protein